MKRATEPALAAGAPVDAGGQANRPRPEGTGPGSAGGGAVGGMGGPGTTDPLVADLRRGGLLPLLVLHLLVGGASYGHQLMERVAEVTGGLLAVNPNTMYPLLRSLEAKGLIAGEWEHPERRSRRFYRLTEAGLRERERLAAEAGPRLDRVAEGIDLLRRELLG